MNIVSLNLQDMGGLSYNLCEAINRLTSHDAVNVVTIRVYTKKPVMVLKNASNAGRIRQLIENADVLHINGSPRQIVVYGVNPKECRDKKIIYHVHGSGFRKSPGMYVGVKKKFPQMKLVVSTPDLLEQAERIKIDATWFPSILQIEELRKRYGIRRNDPPVIYYSPTKAKRFWDLDVLHRAEEKLNKGGFDFRMDIRSRITHDLNMKLKSKADIYFDELKICYGINAIEGAAFELSVIHGITPYVKRYMGLHNIQSPFISIPTHIGGNPPITIDKIEADNEETFKNSLQRLITDDDYRIKNGQLSYRYVKRMHSPEVCVKRFMELVE